MWPSQQYQGGETPSPRNIHTPSHISIASDEMHIELQSKEENSIPESNSLEDNKLSPALSCLPSEDLSSSGNTKEFFKKPLLPTLMTQRIIEWLCQGINLNQLAFGPYSTWTYQQLQLVDCHNNPHLYQLPDTAGEDQAHHSIMRQTNTR